MRREWGKLRRGDSKKIGKGKYEKNKEEEYEEN